MAKETLRKLAEAMPVANERLRRQQRAARDIQLGRQVAAAPARVPQQQAAQALGAQQAQVAGQQAVQREAATQQEAGQLAGMQLSAQELAQQREAAERQAGLEKERIAVGEELSKTEREAAEQIAANQMEFERNQLGEREYQANQLLDWAAVSAKSEEEFKDRAQELNQATEESIRAMEATENRLNFILQNENALKRLEKRGKSKEYIAKLRAETQRAIQKKKAAAKNQQMMAQGLGGLAGAGIGAAAGGPMGAAIGAQVGSGLGGAASGIL